MITKQQNLLLIGRPLKNYSIYYDIENKEIFEEREGVRFMIAGKNEHYSLLRKLVAITQRYHRRKYA